MSSIIEDFVAEARKTAADPESTKAVIRAKSNTVESGQVFRWALTAYTL